MHLPSESLHGAICPVTIAVSITCVAVAAYTLSKQKERPSFQMFALTTLALLTLQAVNYPLPGGFSGHLIGSVLALILLGLPAGILCVSCVLAIQCLLFNDGGLWELGANVLNMSVVASAVGYIVRKGNDSLGKVFIASVSSVLVAVTFVGVELLCSAGTSLSPVTLFKLLYVYHLPVAVIEGIATTAIAYVLNAEMSTMKVKNRTLVIALIIIAFILFPFSSSVPDALETVLSM